MPTTPTGDFAIATTVSADRAHADIVFAGDLDMAAEPELTDTIRRLSTSARETVTVDLAAVTFAGAVLPNFLVKLRQAVPEIAVLTVLHPSQMIHFILQVTDMEQIATINPAIPTPKSV